MRNFGGNAASLLGMVLLLSAIALLWLTMYRPQLFRNQDFFLALVTATCGGILIVEGANLEPSLLFGHYILATITIWYTVESIRLRW